MPLPSDPQGSDHARFSIIAIGASEGGLAAISTILSSFPPHFLAVTCIVQHRNSQHPNLLATILQGLTPLLVKTAEQGDRLLPGTIYIAPPGSHLLVIEHDMLLLSNSAKVRHCRPSADRLFESAAESTHRPLIGVILTGGDGDGTDGIKAIKRNGGTVIVQDRPTSENFSMPRSAIGTGDVDFILPIEDIGPCLVELVWQHQKRFR